MAKLAVPGSCTDRIRVFFVPRHVYVKNLNDFLEHTRLHVERNRLLAKELLAQFPEKFNAVNEDLVQAFLKIHDQSKLNPELTQEGKRFIGERLYEFYGLPDSVLSKAEKAEREALIRELNIVDNVQVTFFFKRNGLLKRNGSPSIQALQLLQIEKIVDFVDRGMAPVSAEEFSKVMEPGSEFIGNDLAKYARYLEKNYRRIVAGFEFRPELD